MYSGVGQLAVRVLGYVALSGNEGSLRLSQRFSLHDLLSKSRAAQVSLCSE